MLAEAERFADDEQLIVADVDLGRIMSDRATTSSYGDSIHDFRRRLRRMRRLEFDLRAPSDSLSLRRRVERFPYVPADPATRNERCQEVYNIQVRGLQSRLLATGIEKVVIGVSGGLDSTHALIVAARTMDRLGLPRENVLGYTLPGFATSERTLRNAHALMKALGVSASELDIRPSATQMLRDLGHPAADGESQYDVTYENVQAGERTSHLFRLANHHRGLVLGTGDLSELALGWATYGVGDHMSHYSVNASVPKTLIQFMIRWAVDTGLFDAEANAVLNSVLDTEISPELVPGDGEHGDGPGQSSESTVGPYELQDFFLYYILRFGYRPSKVAFLADYAWGDRDRGDWPDLIPVERRNQYSLDADPALAGGVPDPLLSDQPVQALGAAQRAQGRIGRIALAALGLAGAQRQPGGSVAAGAAHPRPARRLITAVSRPQPSGNATPPPGSPSPAAAATAAVPTPPDWPAPTTRGGAGRRGCETAGAQR